MGFGTYMVTSPSGPKGPGCPKIYPEVAAVPARPTGQAAFFAARRLQKFGAPLVRGGRLGYALRGAPNF
eukprot:14331766-Alexandrium_andersonii.AAC.1